MKSRQSSGANASPQGSSHRSPRRRRRLSDASSNARIIDGTVSKIVTRFRVDLVEKSLRITRNIVGKNLDAARRSSTP